ncbi:LLM class flavin-dependent oxidoreductase [Streptomyces sp. NRRL WC-3742]|uniref:LLM class flavin-dependent oxidoreductase n=1 Tax=Streptomyces sp. NRRL WC-3742 TaxID=1463934 RepID=UPI0004CBBE1A|nr:LLM class flavin-dependent oxidoreductase [Streptomyces sp. NRRL WC-3742]
MSALRHGVVLLPERRWAEARGRWQRAEELGFDHAWTYDHLMWRMLRAEPWFAAVPTLAAAAAVTSRIGIGTLVAGPAFRHPVTLAKEVMTLDDVSGGRFVLGVGAGGGGYDDEALGLPAPTTRQRTRRFEEFVEITDLLLRRPVTTFEGEHYTARDVHLHPGCLQQPRVPFAVAATGARGLALAARHADIWVTAGHPGWGEPQPYDRALDDLRAQADRLDDACAAIGRDPATLRRLVLTGAMISEVSASGASYQDACGRLAGIGFTDVVSHWPRAGFPYRGSEKVLEEIAEVMAAERAA